MARLVILVATLAVALLVIGCDADEAAFRGGAEAYRQGDFTSALSKWRPLATKGYAAAQFGLGSMYANGEGVPQDDVEAVKWFRYAAEQGNAEAQFNLGAMYAVGRGMPQSYTEAVEWYRTARQLQGLLRAQFNLGGMYANGDGVLQNDVKAYAWLSIAGLQGHEVASNARLLVAQRIPPEARAEAERLAEQYWEAYVEPFRD